MIELHDVAKSFGVRRVLDGLTLQVPKGKTYVLMGRSGTGKSVTLKHVIGVLKPDRGTVLVDGLDVAHLQQHELMNLRKRIGYLFQNGALINWLTVAENVALPLREHARLGSDDLTARVMEVLRVVGMAESAHLQPASISGGMKLRTGLARALVTQPDYVLYDEPNAGLDPIMSDQIHRLIVDVRDQLGVTGLVVTHSRACAFTVADRIGIIEEGRVFAEGTVAEMRANQDPLVRSFLGGGAD